jgi:serine protease Do
LISEDGYIVTNNHVVNEADEINVKLNDGREFEAEVIGLDPQSDLAVIKIEGKNLPFLVLGDSSSLEAGQWAIAVGNPLGLQASVTVGVVSATGRANLDLAPFEDFIQTDAAINRGNSGGPLLDIKGEVIGINTAIASSTGGYMGIGFAIPSNMVKNIKDQLLDKGAVTRGFIGVNLQPIDNDLAQVFNLDQIEGALVANVTEDSPAKAAGLQRGDVILEFNDRRISSIGQFRNAIALMPPGTEITLVVKRENDLIEVPVKIGSHPDNGDKPLEVLANNSLGLTVEPLTSDLAEGEQGVVVTKVDPNSTAALAGIKKGAIILSVNKAKVSTPKEFYNALKNEEGQKGVLLLLKQNEQIHYLFLKNSK